MAWWDTNWAYKRRLRLVNDTDGSAAPYPVCVEVAATAFSLAQFQAGLDARFVDASEATLFPFERALWWASCSAESGMGIFWVRADHVNASDPSHFMWLYWGNSAASDVQQPSAVWDADYVGVWHCEHSAPSFADSTANANALVGVVNVDPFWKGNERLLSRAAFFQATTVSDHGVIPPIAAYDVTEFAVEVALMTHTGGIGQLDTHLDRAGGVARNWGLGNAGVTGYGGFWHGDRSWIVNCSLPGGDVVAVLGARHYAGGGNVVLEGFFDGALVGADTRASIGWASGVTLLVGNDPTLDNAAHFHLDELRISRVPRSAGWMRLFDKVMRGRLVSAEPVTHYESWWDANWTRKRRVYVDNAGRAALYDYPLGVVLNDSTFSFGEVRTDGLDVRFLDKTEQTLLALERAVWNYDASAASRRAQFWVRVPAIEASDASQYVWMYWGNTAASGVHLPSAVWDTTYRGVWHLDETGNTFADSSSYANPFLRDGAASGGAEGLLYSKAVFLPYTANSDRLVGAAQSWYAGFPELTVEAYVRRDAGEVWWTSGAVALIATGNDGWALGIPDLDPAGSDFGFWVANRSIKALSKLAAGQAAHFVGRRRYAGAGNYTVDIFKNGLVAQSVGGGTATDPAATPVTLYVGFDTARWRGLVEEFRYSSGARSTDYVGLTWAVLQDAVVTWGGVTEYGAAAAPASLPVDVVTFCEWGAWW